MNYFQRIWKYEILKLSWSKNLGKVLLIIWLTFFLGSGQYKMSQSFGAHQVFLWSPTSTSVHTSLDPIQEFTTTVSYPYENITNYGLTWSGFKMSYTNSMGHLVWLTQDAISPLTFHLFFSPAPGVSVYYSVFHILVVTWPSHNYLSLINRQYNPQMVGSPSSYSFALNITVNTFVFSIGQDLTTVATMNSVITSSTSVLHSVQIYFQTYYYNTSIFGITILTDSSTDMSIFKANCTFVVVDNHARQTYNYKTYTTKFLIEKASDSPPVKGLYLNSMIVPTQNRLNGIYDKNCLIGMIYLKTSSNQSYVEESVDMRAISPLKREFNNYQFTMRVWIFCLVQCDDGYLYQYNALGCVSCLAHCQFCPSLTTCNQCFSSYYLDPTHSSCHLCEDMIALCQTCLNGSYCLGCFSVKTSSALYLRWDNSCGACSQSIHGCSCGNTTHCFICFNDSTINSNQTCTCIRGHYASNGICTNIIGCFVASQISVNNTKCITCDFNHHFQIQADGFSCTCAQYFTFNSKQQTCSEVCGDGIRITDQCDDGNTRNNDGCSSTCRTELYFHCFSDINSASICTYLSAVSIKLSKVSKSLTQNKGYLSFSVIPNILTLNANNSLLNNLEFYCNSSNFSINQKIYSQSEGLLYLDVEYFSSMEGLQAQLLIQLNQKYFLLRNIALNFTIKSYNLPLIISNKYRQFSILSLNCKILSYLTIAIFVLGSFLGQLVGVQMIQISQLLYILLFYSQNYSFMISILEDLSPTAFLFNFQEPNQNLLNSSLQDKLNRISIKEDFIFNTPIIICLLLALTFIVIACKLVLIVCQYQMSSQQLIEKKKNKNLTKCQVIMQKIINMSFKYLLFPIAAGFFYYLFFSKLISNFTKYQKLSSTFSIHMKAIIKLCCEITISIIFFKEIIRKQNTSRRQLKSIFYKDYYPSMLLTYNLSIYVLFSLSLYVSNTFIFFCLIIGFNGCYICAIFLKKPYTSNFHNFLLIFFQLVTLSFEILLLVKSKSILSEEIELFLMIIIIGMLNFNCIFAFIRIIQMQRQYKKLSQESKQKQLKSMLFQPQKQHSQLSVFPEHKQFFLEFRENIQNIIPLTKQNDNNNFLKKNLLKKEMGRNQLNEIKKNLRESLKMRRKLVNQGFD